MEKSAILVDPGWSDPTDLWGLGYGEDFVLENPVTSADFPFEPGSPEFKNEAAARVRAGLPAPIGYGWHSPRDAHRVLTSYGIWLATNPKTILCLSTQRVNGDLSPHVDFPLGRKDFGTCLGKTGWCEKFCYGGSQRFQVSTTMEKYVSTWEFLYSLYDPRERKLLVPQDVIDDVATAIKQIAMAQGIDNLRWHGIGDLIPEEIPLIDALTRDGDFVVWGFTRRPDVTLRSDFPRRDNVVFWHSVDPSTPRAQLARQIKSAKYHQTGLAYATHYGLGTRGRDPSWHPREKPILKMSQKTPYGPDPVLWNMYKSGLNPHVVFGFHRGGHLTRVFSNGVPVLTGKRPGKEDREGRQQEYLEQVKQGVLVAGDECAATDPFGGGHFHGTCQTCGWCITKPKFKKHRNLLEHRQQMVVDADSFGTKKWGRVSLDTGDRR